jgi:NIMA (never in mitosis gene a)-related kinase
MEYAERGDLMQLIDAHKGNQVNIREDAIWEYLAQICHGLHYLHQKRILHRDIKARNIFLDCDLNVKIGDMGLGRELGPASRFAYTAVGTPLYFSPEMCQEEKYNEKCDVWALGCLIYEMSALKPPFNATNQLALAKRICEEEVEPLPVSAGYSKDLQFIISQMLRKDPEKRPSIQQILAYGPVQQRQYEVLLKRERRLSSRTHNDLRDQVSS